MAFYSAANLVELYDGFCRPFVANGRRLLLLQDGGETYVVENRCPHMDAPLANGRIVDGAIVCRAHGIGFDLRSGRARGPLADTLDCLRFYPVAYEGNKIGVDL
ncbi:Rieske (2Fe-2S) protein [Saccharophagus sp. K07]|jgi:nitrite reductase/ring-hydroxylating ferredoxin subunit|uniref:Rieske (2Fe-2S) protein n=1 Tax=Saccharophagus sp. K07 TaxID=2283636 RepID=UPI001651C5CE|nr:Rieske 2Fe-2S domain-containing protein [Saccharophagus sp. K07]MBC6904898.1 Rieske (2Fe-2S) protein [Saccharophagus sp. K07]